MRKVNRFCSLHLVFCAIKVKAFIDWDADVRFFSTCMSALLEHVSSMIVTAHASDFKDQGFLHQVKRICFTRKSTFASRFLSGFSAVLVNTSQS